MAAVQPHFFTLTGNLLAERTLEFSTWSPGATQRARGATFQVGGKGINVAKMLARLGTPHTALCFTGGATGAECEAWLRERGFSFRSFSSQTATRAGVVVRGGEHAETTFLGPDVAPSADALAQCAAFIDAQNDGNVLALCGSAPGWADETYAPVRAALERWAARGALVVDSYGPPLGWAVQQPTALVKINATELRGLAAGSEAVPERLEKLRREAQVQRWIVTDGPGAVWVCDHETAPISFTPPPVQEVSATGSGDVLLACVLELFCRQSMALKEAVQHALPYASANAAHPGIAEFVLPV